MTYHENHNPSPPPSPPPQLPARGETISAVGDGIPIVFGQALPLEDDFDNRTVASTSGISAISLPTIATACELVVEVDESTGATRNSYSVSPVPPTRMRRSSTIDTYATPMAPTLENPYYSSSSNSSGSGSTYATSTPGNHNYGFNVNNRNNPPVAVGIPMSPTTTTTSPASAFASQPPSYNSYTSSSYTSQQYSSSQPYRPNRPDFSAASTATPMTTENGLRLTQLPMVNLEGRRMTPYVTNNNNNNNNPSSYHRHSASATYARPAGYSANVPQQHLRSASYNSGPTSTTPGIHPNPSNNSNPYSYSVRPGSRMTPYV